MTEDTMGTRQRGTEALGLMSLGCILNCVAVDLAGHTPLKQW